MSASETAPDTRPRHARTSAIFRTIFADRSVVILEDLAHRHATPTITNDAEAVVRAVADTLNGRRLFYLDTAGRVDELLVGPEGFAGFSPGFDSLEAARRAFAPLEDQVEAFVRAVLAGDDTYALARCPFTWEAGCERNTRGGPEMDFRVAIRSRDGVWIAGYGHTVTAALRAAIDNMPSLAGVRDRIVQDARAAIGAGAAS